MGSVSGGPKTFSIEKSSGVSLKSMSLILAISPRFKLCPFRIDLLKEISAKTKQLILKYLFDGFEKNSFLCKACSCLLFKPLGCPYLSFADLSNISPSTGLSTSFGKSPKIPNLNMLSVRNYLLHFQYTFFKIILAFVWA